LILNSIIFKQGIVKFVQVNNLLCQVEIVSELHKSTIPLLFETTDIDRIKQILNSLKIKDGTSFNLFTSIVAGCIRTCMRHR
jgi:hypothetical protein